MEISNGIILMILGMGGVFAILAFMYFIMRFALFIDEKFKPKKGVSLFDDNEQELIQKAVISVTLHHHNKKIRGIK